MSHDIDDEPLGELLMQRATGALSAAEADALARALASLPPGEVARWERAAAELTSVLAESASEPMPAALAEQVITTGEAMVRSQQRDVLPVRVEPVRAFPRFSVYAGWMAAAAAIALWVMAPRTTPTVPVVAAVTSVAVLRDSLLTRDTASRTLVWTATADSSAKGASGDVVWSNRAQAGVMRIVGLEPNTTKRWQYQLWIFDRTRDDRYPVDGGVFDVPAGASEVLIPIDARLPVGEAVMFAVTVEPPGGVVVSKRERIVLLAKAGA